MTLPFFGGGPTPVLRPPAGIFWRARILEEFSLALAPQIDFGGLRISAGTQLHLTTGIGMSGAGKSPAAMGLSLTPSFGVSGSSNQADVVLHLTPSLVMDSIGPPNADFTLSRTLTIGMTGAEKYASTLGLSLTPSIGMSGAGHSPVAYDATGTGFLQTASSTGVINGTWSHTATAGAAVVVAVEVYSWDASATSYASRTVTYDGVAMTSLGVRNAPSNEGWVELFGLTSAPGGTKTVAVNLPARSPSSGLDTIFSVVANSVSYNNASAFGTAVSNSGTGTSLSSGSVTSATGRMVAHAFAAFEPSGSATTVNLSAYNRTSRYLNNFGSSGGDRLGFQIGDAAGASTVSFAATAANTANWASLAVDLQP